MEQKRSIALKILDEEGCAQSLQSMGSVNVNKQFRVQTAAASSAANRQTNLMSVGKRKCKQKIGLKQQLRPQRPIVKLI